MGKSCIDLQPLSNPYTKCSDIPGGGTNCTWKYGLNDSGNPHPCVGYTKNDGEAMCKMDNNACNDIRWTCGTEEDSCTFSFGDQEPDNITTFKNKDKCNEASCTDPTPDPSSYSTCGDFITDDNSCPTGSVEKDPPPDCPDDGCSTDYCCTVPTPDPSSYSTCGEFISDDNSCPTGSVEKDPTTDCPDDGCSTDYCCTNYTTYIVIGAIIFFLILIFFLIK